MLRTLVRVCNKRCAPRSVHCICCFFTNRRLTTWLMVDSTKAVLIVSPCRVPFAEVRNELAVVAVDSGEESFERHAEFFPLAAAPLSGVGGLTGTDDVAAGTRRALRF